MMTCPKCRNKMWVASSDTPEELFNYRFECTICGYIEAEEDFDVANDGINGPVFLTFKDEKEFEIEIDKLEFEMQTRTVREIDKSIIDGSDYVIIAWLNTREKLLGIMPEEYFDHIVRAREYFEEIEDYERCIECKKLETKIKEL